MSFLFIKNLSRLVAFFCLFFNDANAMNDDSVSDEIIVKQHYSEQSLSVLIDEKPHFKNLIMETCLQLVTTLPLSPQDIIDFFNSQQLVNYVDELQISSSSINTFQGKFGVEFFGHGPVEREVFKIIESMEGNSIRFMDFGAGYGGLALTLLKRYYSPSIIGCELKAAIEFDLCELISIQCYHAAKKLREYSEGFPEKVKDMIEHYQSKYAKNPELIKTLVESINIYPQSILDLDVNTNSPRYHISTCLNVLHFVIDPTQLDKTAKCIANLTIPGGYHVAAAQTPYANNAKAVLEEYERRKATREENPGYFSPEDKEKFGAQSLLPSYLFEVDTLRKPFEENGFEIIGDGYYNIHKGPGDSCYIIARKK